MSDDFNLTFDIEYCLNCQMSHERVTLRRTKTPLFTDGKLMDYEYTCPSDGRKVIVALLPSSADPARLSVWTGIALFGYPN